MNDWKPIVTEEYDRSWPHNLQWGVSSTGDVEVWEPTESRYDEHRQYLQNVWGRPVHVGTGDIIGRCQYIPAEMHVDGSVVAPPEIQVQTYYGTEIPELLIDWFHDRFPGVVVRGTTRRKVTKEASEPQMQTRPRSRDHELKWVWNANDGILVWDDDTPGHSQKVKEAWGRDLNTGLWTTGSSLDFVGYINKNDNEFEIEASQEIPAHVRAAVKEEVARQYPDSGIRLDNQEKSGFDPDYGDRDLQIGREKSAAWAWRTFAANKGEGSPYVPAKATEKASKRLRLPTWGDISNRVSRALGGLTKRSEVAMPELGQIQDFDFDNWSVRDFDTGWRAYVVASPCIEDGNPKPYNLGPINSSWEEARQWMLDRTIRFGPANTLTDVRAAFAALAPDTELRYRNDAVRYHDPCICGQSNVKAGDPAHSSWWIVERMPEGYKNSRTA